MVRQGFAPLTMNGQPASETNPAWSSFNVLSLTSDDPKDGWRPGNYHANMVASPLDEGSYFRWNNPNAIKSSNNDKAGFGFGETPGDTAKYDVIKNRPGQLDKLTWSQLAGGYNRGNNAWKIDNDGVRVAKYEDFKQLESTVDSHI